MANDDEEEDETLPPLQGSSVSNERARAKEFVRDYFKAEEQKKSRDKDKVPLGREKGSWQQRQEPKGRGQWQGHPRKGDRQEGRHFGGERRVMEERQREEGTVTQHAPLHKPTSRDSTGSGQVQGTVQPQGVGAKPRTSTARTSNPGNAGTGHPETRAGRTETTRAQEASQSEPRTESKPSSSKSSSGPSQSEKRARQLKDKNKTSRANHGRKALADKKRRGGMM